MAYSQYKISSKISSKYAVFESLFLDFVGILGSKDKLSSLYIYNLKFFDKILIEGAMPEKALQYALFKNVKTKTFIF